MWGCKIPGFYCWYLHHSYCKIGPPVIGDTKVFRTHRKPVVYGNNSSDISNRQNITIIFLTLHFKDITHSRIIFQTLFLIMPKDKQSVLKILCTHMILQLNNPLDYYCNIPSHQSNHLLIDELLYLSQEINTYCQHVGWTSSLRSG